MIKQIYKKQELPMADLQRVGLAKNGSLLLDEDDLSALLAGRRTDMLRLENLQVDGLVIPALDAKLSLRPVKTGGLELLVHPIYKELEAPYFLTKDEAQKLESGELTNIDKFITDKDNKTKQVLVEFDKDTNEFVITDTEQILAPEEINGIPLTPEQKEKYRKGKEVKTEDGTTIQYTANEKEGIRSDKLALIASMLIDGGISYVLYKGLHALFGKEEQKASGSNYDKAYNDRSKANTKEKHYPKGKEQGEVYTGTVSR